MKRRGFLKLLGLSPVAALPTPTQARDEPAEAVRERPLRASPAGPVAGSTVFTDDQGNKLVYIRLRKFNRLPSYWKPGQPMDAMVLGKHSAVIPFQHPLDNKFYVVHGDGGLGSFSSSSHHTRFDPHAGVMDFFYPPQGFKGKVHPVGGTNPVRAWLRSNGEVWFFGDYSDAIVARTVKTFEVTVPANGVAVFDFDFPTASEAAVEFATHVGNTVTFIPSVPLPAGITVTGQVTRDFDKPPPAQGRLTFRNSTGSLIHVSSRSYEISSSNVEWRAAPNAPRPMLPTPMVGVIRAGRGTWRWTPSTNTWEQLSTYVPPWSSSENEAHGAAYDAGRDCVWIVNGTSLRKFDPKVSPVGPASWSSISLNFTATGGRVNLGEASRDPQLYYPPTDEVILYAKFAGALVNTEYGVHTDALLAVKVTTGAIRYLKTPFIGPHVLNDQFGSRSYANSQHSMIIKGSTFIFTEVGHFPRYQAIIRVSNVGISPIAGGAKIVAPSPIYTSHNGFIAGAYVQTKGFKNAANNGVFLVTGRDGTPGKELYISGAGFVAEGADAAHTVNESYYSGPEADTQTDYGGFWWYNMDTGASGHGAYPADVQKNMAVPLYNSPLLPYVMDDRIHDRLYYFIKDGQTPDTGDLPYMEFQWRPATPTVPKRRSG